MNDVADYTRLYSQVKGSAPPPQIMPAPKFSAQRYQAQPMGQPTGNSYLSALYGRR